VVSFNLRLGLAETWAGAVVPTASGARLITRSTSCTEPAFEAAGDGSSYLDLSSQAYSGSAADGMGVELERVREGYVEAFAMSELFSPGIPFTCGDFQSGTMLLDELSLDGGIAGTLSLINVATEWSLAPTPLHYRVSLNAANTCTVARRILILIQCNEVERALFSWIAALCIALQPTPD